MSYICTECNTTMNIPYMQGNGEAVVSICPYCDCMDTVVKSDGTEEYRGCKINAVSIKDSTMRAVFLNDKIML